MKKFLSMLLTVALVVSMLCLPAVADTTLDGDGTKENPYLIKTADDFAKAQAILEGVYYEVAVLSGEEVSYYKRYNGLMADGSQVYFKLAPASDSIDVSAVALEGNLLLSKDGARTPEDKEVRQQFAGVLDGNNVTLDFKGVTVTLDGSPAGVLVDYLCGVALDTDEDDVTDTTCIARIKNLTIANIKVNAVYAGSGQVGILAGSVDGISTIDGVHIVDAEMDSSVAYTHNKAGLVGKRNGGTLTIQNCTFSGVMKDSKSKDRNGALVGSLAGSNSVTIKNCTVNADITCAGNAGGLVAFQEGNGKLTISKCTTSGSITATGGTVPGGVIGTFSATPDVKIDNTVSNVTITGLATKTHYAGGFIGRITGANGVYKFTNCVNTGAVKASHAGGFIGQANKLVSLTFINCINTGAITDIRTDNASASAGGFIGSISVGINAVLSNCHNGGAIGTEKTAKLGFYGGIVGWVQANVPGTLTIQNCTNSGNIHATNSGAILGANSSTSATLAISNCINFNDAIGTTYVSNVETTGCTYVNADYAPTSTATLFQVLDGARIRVSSKGAADNGIRFDIAVDQALVEALVAAGYEVELKSLMALESSVNATNFTKETLTAMGEKFTNSKTPATVKQDGTYAAALINLAIEQYATEFACVGYLVATKGNETITFYTAYDADNARSIAYVANAALEDNENGQYDAYKTVLENFAKWLPAEN